MPKNIFIFFDGTWNDKNDESKERTNIAKLFDALKDDDGVEEHQSEFVSVRQTEGQVAFYTKGVGSPGGWDDSNEEQSFFDKVGSFLKDTFTLTRTRNLVRSIFGGAFGFGIDRIIKSAYGFLIENYDPGDRILVFGFSRGSFAARSFVGLIRNVGLIDRDKQPDYDVRVELANEAYKIYQSKEKANDPDSKYSIAFRNKNSHLLRDVDRNATGYTEELSVKINFLGVYDTVGALGYPQSWAADSDFFNTRNIQKYGFHNFKLSKIVVRAYHALAIDELRHNFKPTPWEVSGKTDANGKKLTHSKQRWFPGWHSNVGGGNPEAKTEGFNGLLSDHTLEWMIRKVNKWLPLDSKDLNSVIKFTPNCPYENNFASDILYTSLTAKIDPEKTTGVGGGTFTRSLFHNAKNAENADRKLSKAAWMRYTGEMKAFDKATNNFATDRASTQDEKMIFEKIERKLLPRDGGYPDKRQCNFPYPAANMHRYLNYFSRMGRGDKKYSQDTLGGYHTRRQRAKAERVRRALEIAGANKRVKYSK